MIRTFSLVAFFAFTIVPCARASVLVVAPSGASFTTIQSAVDAAVDGDTLLVKPGTYPGFALDAKSLTIAADPEGSVSLSSATSITNIASTQSVVLSGMSCVAALNGGLTAVDCAGHVRFEAITTTSPAGPTSWPDAVRVAACDDVAILRCTLTGWASFGAFPSNPGSGLVLWQGSRVALYDSIVMGGRGSSGQIVGPGLMYPPLSGAAGCTVFGSSTLFISGSSMRGGDGGAGTPGLCFPSPLGGGTGASGGAGLSLEAGSIATILDASLAGGTGGNGGSAATSCSAPAGPTGANGAGSTGNAVNIPGTARHVTTPSLVRELSPFTVSVAGLPGDQVWLQIGGTPTWAFDPAFNGVRLVSTVQRSTRLFLGVLPASGTLVTTFAFPDMGPGVQARTNYVQALFRDTSGTNVLGSGEVFGLIDGAF